MRYAVQTVVLVVVLGAGLVVTSEDFWLWLLPDRFLVDCAALTARQQVIVRTNGLPAVGIWGKCK